MKFAFSLLEMMETDATSGASLPLYHIAVIIHLLYQKADCQAFTS